jgi:RNA polymerase sigma-70 factor (ECF subfamily)
MQSDEELLTQIQGFDRAAYEMRHDRYAIVLRRHLARLVHDQTAADDLLQETFLRVWTRALQWHGSGSAKSWIYRIATNLAYTHLDQVRRRRQESYDGAEDDDGDTPAWMIDVDAMGADAALQAKEDRQALQGIIDALPQDQKEVFHMFYQEEKEVHQVAEALGIPQGTVKSRLFYARKELARQWHQLEINTEDD